MLSFKFHGKDSYSDMGIYMEKRPLIPSPERRVSYFSMPGRSGSLSYDEGAYEDITLSVSCGIAGKIDSRISDIKAWLFEGGEGDLIFSYSPDRKYIAQVVNRIDFEVALSKLGFFIIIFHCQPFQYAVENIPLTVTTSGTNLICPGNIASEPIIEVYGSGDLLLSFSGQQIQLKGVQEKIILNCPLQEAYNESLQNRNSIMQGAFPSLYAGDNEITWVGNVEKLVITPNARWL